MTFQNIVRIKNKTIGAGQPAFIIAELGVNHGGDADVAAKMIEAAAAA
ncbi:MAG: N-acetylneuraminate synthase, partial [Elusimicrobia bacterium]|nr:N-acetylneuraminate synthase [Elusimicrobiota bacterium]